MKTMLFVVLATMALLTKLHLDETLTQFGPIDRAVGQLLAAVGFVVG